MNSSTSFSSIKKLHVFVLLLLFIKTLLLFFTQTIDADAVTRSQLASQLLANPKWITEGTWPPLHIYLTSLSLWMYNDIIYSPRIMNILFSALTLYPIYFFLHREFNSTKAFLGVLIFALSPVIIHTSLMNLSETSFFLFVAMGINFLSKALKKDELKHFILSGLFLTLAAAIRLEAWPLIALFSFTILLNKKFIHCIVFSLVAAIFPIFWMYGNYVAHNDPLFSIRAIDILESQDWEGFIRKIWFFPFMLFISIGPVFIFAIIKGSRNWKYNIKSPWLIVPIALFSIILYKSITGTMIAHPRFIGLTTLLSLPLILQESDWLKKILQKNAYIVISIALTIGLSFIYNMDNISPLPTLKNKEMLTYRKLLEHRLNNEECIFIDFINWEDSYFLALQLYSFSTNQIVIDGYTSEQASFKLFQSTYNKSEDQIWIINPNHANWLTTIDNCEIITQTTNIIIAISNAD